MSFLLLLQQMRTPALDALMLVATRLGEEVFVLAPLLLCYWCLDRELGLRIGFTYFAGGIVNQFAKLAFRVERPFVRDARIQPHPRAVGTATGYSFPSGHTTSATALAAALALRWKKKGWVWLLGGLYVALVGFSRMYLGVHTPADVLGGFVLTALMAVAVDLILRDVKNHPAHIRIYFALGAAAALALLLYAQGLVATGAAPESQAVDAFKTCGAAFALLLGLPLERRYVRFTVDAPPRAQAVKFLCGLVLALVIKGGLRAVLGTSLPMQFVRYFVTVLFVVLGYPLLFTRVMKKKTGERT